MRYLEYSYDIVKTMLVSALKHQRLLSPYVRLFVEIAVLYTAPFV